MFKSPGPQKGKQQFQLAAACREYKGMQTLLLHVGHAKLCLEFADEILIVAVLKQRLLQRRETEVSFL